MPRVFGVPAPRLSLARALVLLLGALGLFAAAPAWAQSDTPGAPVNLTATGGLNQFSATSAPGPTRMQVRLLSGVSRSGTCLCADGSAARLPESAPCAVRRRFPPFSVELVGGDPAPAPGRYRGPFPGGRRRQVRRPASTSAQSVR